MGPDSGKKVIKVEYDDIVDERTVRRWKRRGIAIGSSSSNLHCSTSTKKRSRDNAEVGGTMLELDKNCERCWNVNQQNVIQIDSDDSSDCKILDDGDGGNDGDDEDDVNQHFDDKNKRPLDDGQKEHSDDDDDLGDDDDTNSRSIHANSFNGLVDDGLMDPQYKDFWNHVTVVGNSLILELDEEDGSVKQIRYEDNSPYEPDLDNVPAEAADETESDSTVTDDVYQEFLNCLQMHGDSMVFTPKNGGPLMYEEDSSSDSDVEILNRDPSYCTPFVDLDSEQHTEDISQFRQGLMKDLKRPYNSDEYLELLVEWSRQRPPKTHEKNLRNGNVKTYHLPGEFGKSYQETYRDLAGMLDAVINDRPKSLNLLRGFFYWLKNVAQKGSFVPWNDSECLKVWLRAAR